MNRLAKTRTWCREVLWRYHLLFTAVWKINMREFYLCWKTDQLEDLESLGMVMIRTTTTAICDPLSENLHDSQNFQFLKNFLSIIYSV